MNLYVLSMSRPVAHIGEICIAGSLTSFSVMEPHLPRSCIHAKLDKCSLFLPGALEQFIFLESDVHKGKISFSLLEADESPDCLQDLLSFWFGNGSSYAMFQTLYTQVVEIFWQLGQH